MEFDQERTLYGAEGILVKDCRFGKSEVITG